MLCFLFIKGPRRSVLGKLEEATVKFRIQVYNFLLTCCGRRLGAKGKKASLTIGLLGLVLIAIGALVMFVRPYDLIFKWKILFAEGGEIFDIWRRPPVDLYLRVHLFNITNADEFLSGADDRLRVREVGPYVYREAMSHENVTFNANGTVSASPRHPLEWVPELSTGDHETDELTLVNIALLSIADVVSKKSAWQRWGLNLLISQTKTQPIVKMSPKEFMFGYQSTLMTLGFNLLPTWINFDKLGLIDRMYNFEGDYETVYTGEGDAARAGLIDTYRGSRYLPQWGDTYCGDVRSASDGTKFRGELAPDDELKFFRKSLCRAKPMRRVGETTASGLRGYVYRFPENANDNGVYDKKNRCFCRTEKCLPPGLLDVRECYYGFPIALSYPHFLDGDVRLSENVEGLEPNRSRHESYFVINPESGLPLDLAVRYQINMAIGDTSGVANSEKFANTIVPMLWTENRLYRLPDDLASRFNVYLAVLPLVDRGSIALCLVAGVVLVALGLHRHRKNRRVRWLDNELASAVTISARKRHNRKGPEAAARLTDKELEVYYDSLTAPLNQKIDVRSGDDSEDDPE